MQILKFLLGIVLVQIVTVILFSISPIDFDDILSLLRLTLPLFFMALMVAIWFSSLSSHLRKDSEYKMSSKFSKEREALKVNAERAKTKVVKEAQRDIAQEAKVTHAKANFKVGVAFAGVLGVGVLFIFAQLITAGLLTLSVAGGVVGGYYWRGKRIGNDKRLKELELVDTKVITQ